MNNRLPYSPDFMKTNHHHHRHRRLGNREGLHCSEINKAASLFLCSFFLSFLHGTNFYQSISFLIFHLHFAFFHFTQARSIQKISESGSSDGKNDISYLLLKTIHASVPAVTAAEAPSVTGLYHCEVPVSLSGAHRCHLAPWCYPTVFSTVSKTQVGVN